MVRLQRVALHCNCSTGSVGYCRFGVQRVHASNTLPVLAVGARKPTECRPQQSVVSTITIVEHPHKEPDGDIMVGLKHIRWYLSKFFYIGLTKDVIPPLLRNDYGPEYRQS